MDTGRACQARLVSFLDTQITAAGVGLLYSKRPNMMRSFRLSEESPCVTVE